ncbi:MAG TPA: hypothetical protein VEX38_06245 [Fimbriimonadaceae bacterium]|nr:hypothetical protein [Fimbriimonadaceae bacterium]
MSRGYLILIGGILGATMVVTAFAIWLNLKYPNNYRDSGMPDLAVALILAGPPGFLLGGIAGALVRRR